MKKEFVPYELALELRELGFDEPCLLVYDSKEKVLFHCLSNNVKNDILIDCNIGLNPKEDIKAPTFSQAFRWFREKYDLVIEPCVPFQRLYSTEEDHFEILEFGYRIYSFDQYRGGLRDKIEWDGYDNSNEEEAELECLKKLIEIIKK